MFSLFTALKLEFAAEFGVRLYESAVLLGGGYPHGASTCAISIEYSVENSAKRLHFYKTGCLSATKPGSPKLAL